MVQNGVQAIMVKQFASGGVRGQAAPSPRYCSRGNANKFCQRRKGFVGMLQTHAGVVWGGWVCCGEIRGFWSFDPRHKEEVQGRLVKVGP